MGSKRVDKRNFRLFGLRKATNPPNNNDLQVPFYYYKKHVSEITPTIGIPTRTIVGKFPDNVKEWIWTHEGTNDEESWYGLALLQDGLYALFIAWCDYTGFGCRDGKSLYIGTYEEIIKYGLDDIDYRVYINNTDEIPVEDDE